MDPSSLQIKIDLLCLLFLPLCVAATEVAVDHCLQKARSMSGRPAARAGCGVGSRPSEPAVRCKDFRFDAPNFVVLPQILSGYAELKVRLTPRVFAAVREGFLKTESVLDTQGVAASEFAPTLQATELGMGYWLRPRVLAKVSYEFMQAAGSGGTRSNVLGMQLVATFNQLQWGWK